MSSESIAPKEDKRADMDDAMVRVVAISSVGEPGDDGKRLAIKWGAYSICKRVIGRKGVKQVRYVV